MPGISAGGSQGRNLVGNAGTPPISCRWSVPIDDSHSLMIRLVFKPADNPGTFAARSDCSCLEGMPIKPYKEYVERGERGAGARLHHGQRYRFRRRHDHRQSRRHRQSRERTRFAARRLRHRRASQALSGSLKAVMDGKDPDRASSATRPTMASMSFPAWEYDVSEQEFKKGIAETAASSAVRV